MNIDKIDMIDVNTFNKKNNNDVFDINKYLKDIDKAYFFSHLNGFKYVVSNPDELPFVIKLPDDHNYLISFSLLNVLKYGDTNKYEYIFCDDISLCDSDNNSFFVSFQHGFLHNENFYAIYTRDFKLYCLLGFYVTPTIFNTYKEKLSFKNNVQLNIYTIEKLHLLYRDHINKGLSNPYNSDSWDYYYNYLVLNENNINVFLDIFNSGAWYGK